MQTYEHKDLFFYDMKMWRDNIAQTPDHGIINWGV